nr:paramyosin [Helicoverpa armigera]
MPEQLVKVPRSASPVARAGAGDISERELSRERHNLQTPPARLQPAHPKKQLFSAPVNKFTAKWCAPSPNLARIRSCLDAYANQETPVRPVAKTKAASMEDLTPTKRILINRKNGLGVVESPVPSATEELAAARVCRFMVVAAWRRRREDVRCLRKTLETQVSYSERLRIQVSTLKSLLDSDNAKVRMAMRELERLKQLLRDKEMEKSVLEREKRALEDDVCAAEDRASEISIGWRNCRNELEGVRAAAARGEQALARERAAHADTVRDRDNATTRLAILEEELAQHEELLSSAEAEVAALRRETDEKQILLQATSDRLAQEEEARSLCSRKCEELNSRVSAAAEQTTALRAELAELRELLARLQAELALTREQLDWWPKPLTKMLGAARSWFRNPKAVHETLLWTLTPARHGIP